MLKLTHFAIAAAAALMAAAPAAAKPPLEAFGEFPEVRSMQLSPDGERVAYLLRRGDVEQLMVIDLKTKKQEALATVTDFKAQGITFAGPNYVLLHASVTRRNVYYLTDKFEHTGAFAVNLETKKAVRLLRRATSLHPAQSGLGIVDGLDPGGKHVFMPAYIGELRDPTYNLLRVNLDTGDGASAGGKEGSSTTRDWILNGRGQVVAREDWSDKTNRYSIRTYDGDTSREIFSRDEPRRLFNIMGLSTDEKSLIVADMNGSEFYNLFEMSLADGSLKGPILKRTDADVESVITGHDNIVRGVRYAGMVPSYEIFDDAVEADIKAIQGQLPASAVYLDSWSDDWSKILLSVSGGGLSERYVLFDRKARKMEVLGFARPAIKTEDVGEVIIIEYKASDGLKIPALVTWPTGIKADARKNLPMIVMPHGGPESYDGVGFDWLAQYFANEGYLVLQPNFRGSGGFGESFAVAGHGQWGRKMQSDIADGANALVRMGWVDPNRTCIIGWSYGGYAALAGGGITPDLYKCVVSVAGVSDLIAMLGDEQRDASWYSARMDYWEKLIGDPQRDRAAIEAVSPANMASNYKAPVLLIHGAEDLVVPVKQSELMENALKKAGKDVTYLRMKGDDHSLSNSDNRRAALEAMSSFVAKHIGK